MKVLKFKGNMLYGDIFNALNLFIEEYDNVNSEKYFDGEETQIIFSEECLIIIEYVTGVVYTDYSVCPINVRIFGKDPKKIHKVKEIILEKFEICDLIKTEIKDVDEVIYF